MDKKKQYIWALIIAVGILASAAIIFPSALAFSGNNSYLKGAEINAQPLTGPETVVDAFYTWYIHYLGDRAADSFRNPLVDKAYQVSEYLTLSYIDHVDEILMEMGERSNYDPFLCAQDIPQEMNPDSTFWHGGQASVIVRSDLENHFVTVDLQKINDDWKIGNIICGSSPEGTAKTFYTWYLAHIGDQASGEIRNPLVDKAYRESGFLSARFIQELDDLTEAGIPADPILMAQDIPQDFSVDPGTDMGTAVVHLQFGTETIHHLKVSMIQEMGAWKIDSIEQAK